MRRETYFEVSGRTEKAVEARSTGVEPPTTSTTSVEASITQMGASTTATEAPVEVAGSLYKYQGLWNVTLLTRTLRFHRSDGACMMQLV